MTQPDNETIISSKLIADSHNSVLVSIIIPVYNTAPYVHRAIESSLRQNHKNVEVLVVDDGSTDDTLRVIKSYAEKDCRVKVYHQENAGVSAARNHGIREAKGEYLVFLDSDDWLEDDAVEVLLEAQVKYPDMMIASNVYSVKLDKDKFLRCKRNSSIVQVFSIEDTIYAFCQDTLMPTMCAKIFRADLICQYNLNFRVGMHYGEDQLFTFDYLIKMNGCYYTSKPLYNYLDRPGSAVNIPLSERRKNKEGLFPIILNYHNISPEIRTATELSYAISLRHTIRAALINGVSYDYLKKLRNKAKLYISLIMSAKVSFPKKVYFMCLVYLPRPLSKIVICVWDWFKSRRNVEKSEPVPYW